MSKEKKIKVKGKAKRKVLSERIADFAEVYFNGPVPPERTREEFEESVLLILNGKDLEVDITAAPRCSHEQSVAACH